MKMKCIGGPLDGYWNEVHSYLIRKDEIVKILKPITGLSCVSFNPNIEPKTLEFSYYYYKVSKFIFSNNAMTDELWFLIPENWSNREAILHQFGK